MAIDAGQAFKRGSVEPFFDKIPVHAVDDFCGLFRISAGHIKFRKADDLKAALTVGGIQNLAGFSVTVGCIGVGHLLHLFLTVFFNNNHIRSL